MSEKQFSRSMYASSEDLYKAKAEYYERLYRESEQAIIVQVKQSCKDAVIASSLYEHMESELSRQVVIDQIENAIAAIDAVGEEEE